ncbi:hypothetical protein [Sciscionella sediminilitoris]|uniref:hypothetical protein n=1 Tax=Sciscionella sediminilitoris TaxID=1445613 RepID=UPI00068E9164|nr:hypothetical protein [Sciscionella sp. SE31]
MTWQDELRRLEDDLVNGRVSAEDYRIRRDQLLSSANASPPPDTSMDSTQFIPPITDTGADATQVVGRQPQQQPPQQPQQQQWQPGQQPQAYQQGYQQGYQQPQQPQQGMFDQPPQEDNDPPWAGDEFPPLAAGSSEWVKQGPETGEQNKGARGKVIGIVAGVVLIVVLAVGAWLLFGQSSGSQPPQAGGDKNNAQGQGGGEQPKPKPKPDQLGLIDPPGQPEDHANVKDLQSLSGANYLNPQEQQAYTNAVVGKTVFKVSHQGENTFALVAAKASTPQGATEAVKELNDAELSNGMKKLDGQPKGVAAAQVQPNKAGENSEIRAHYAHGTEIVRVHVYGPDFATVQQQFTKVLQDQLKAVPADG